MAKPALDLTELTSEEKLALIDDIWASIDFQSLPLPPELEAELDRRLDRLEAEGPRGIPWEQVRAEMVSR